MKMIAFFTLAILLNISFPVLAAKPCTQASEKFAIEAVQAHIGSREDSVDLFKEYNRVIDQNPYAITYSILLGVGKTDYAAILTLEIKTCSLLGSHVYQASFN